MYQNKFLVSSLFRNKNENKTDCNENFETREMGLVKKVFRSNSAKCETTENTGSTNLYLFDKKAFFIHNEMNSFV